MAVSSHTVVLAASFLPAARRMEYIYRSLQPSYRNKLKEVRSRRLNLHFMTVDEALLSL